jgi:hypothetical protein
MIPLPYKASPVPDLQASQRSLANAPVSLGEYLGATVDETLAHSPMASIASWVQRANVETNEDNLPLISTDELNQKYAHLGLTFDHPMTEIGADFLAAHREAELNRNDVLERGGSGAGRKTLGFITSIGASMLDPLNVAAVLVPGLGEANEAKLLAMAGTRLLPRAAARFGAAAIQGAAGMTALEPFNYLGASATGTDYGPEDTMRNLTFGAVLAGMLHSGIGAFGDLSPVTQREALGVAVADTAQNQRTSAAELAKLDPSNPDVFANLEALQKTVRDGEMKSPDSFGSYKESTPQELASAIDQPELAQIHADTERILGELKAGSDQLPREVTASEEFYKNYNQSAESAYMSAAPCVLENLL